MVFAGLQLSGVLATTLVSRRVTLVLPVAIPPPLEALFSRTVLPVSEGVPRLEIAPPGPPEVLRVNVLREIRDVPPDWVFRPPPLIGAVFPVTMVPSSVSGA